MGMTKYRKGPKKITKKNKTKKCTFTQNCCKSGGFLMIVNPLWSPVMLVL